MTPESPSAPPSRRVLRHLPKVALIVLALSAVAAMRMIPQRQIQTEAHETPAVNVEVLDVTATAALPDRFVVPAVVEPNRVVTVSAEVAGRVEFVAREGRPVATGQTLLRINADLIRPQVERARAQVERDRIQLERMRNLVASKATSQQDLDNTAADLATSRAALAEAEARLERAHILSPGPGVLDEALVEAGEYVTPGTPVARLVATNPVRVVVDLPEQDVPFFAKGQAAEVLLAAQGDEPVRTGRIDLLRALADTGTRSTHMEILVSNDDGSLHSGRIVRVRLTRRVLADALMIPLRAVIPLEEGYAVYVVRGDRAERREVSLGLLQGDQVQILSGLSVGDRLVIAGHRFLAPGQKVTIPAEKD